MLTHWHRHTETMNRAITNVISSSSEFPAMTNCNCECVHLSLISRPIKQITVISFSLLSHLLKSILMGTFLDWGQYHRVHHLDTGDCVYCICFICFCSPFQVTHLFLCDVLAGVTGSDEILHPELRACWDDVMLCFSVFCLMLLGFASQGHQVLILVQKVSIVLTVLSSTVQPSSNITNAVLAAATTQLLLQYTTIHTQLFIFSNHSSSNRPLCCGSVCPACSKH